MHHRPMTRRSFTGACLAASLATNFSARAASDFGDFKMGAQSYTWRNFSLEKALEEMSKLGLRHVEFATNHLAPTATNAQIDSILRLCKSLDLVPAAAGVFPFTNDNDKNRPYFEFGKKIGAKMLSADPAPDSFDALDKLCEEYQIAVAIHPHGPIGPKLHHWYSAEIILAAVKDHHPLIGSCLDTGHLIRSAQDPFGKKLDPAQQITLMGKRNFGIHLKDHDNKTKEDVIYGKGVLDVASVFRALKDVGFNGSISVEYEAHPDNPSPDVSQCLDVVRAALKTV